MMCEYALSISSAMNNSPYHERGDEMDVKDMNSNQLLFEYVSLKGQLIQIQGQIKEVEAEMKARADAMMDKARKGQGWSEDNG